MIDYFGACMTAVEGYSRKDILVHSHGKKEREKDDDMNIGSHQHWKDHGRGHI